MNCLDLVCNKESLPIFLLGNNPNLPLCPRCETEEFVTILCFTHRGNAVFFEPNYKCSKCSIYWSKSEGIVETDGNSSKENLAQRAVKESELKKRGETSGRVLYTKTFSDRPLTVTAI